MCFFALLCMCFLSASVRIFMLPRMRNVRLVNLRIAHISIHNLICNNRISIKHSSSQGRKNSSFPRYIYISLRKIREFSKNTETNDRVYFQHIAAVTGVRATHARSQPVFFRIYRPINGIPRDSIFIVFLAERWEGERRGKTIERIVVKDFDHVAGSLGDEKAATRVSLSLEKSDT